MKNWREQFVSADSTSNFPARSTDQGYTEEEGASCAQREPEEAAVEPYFLKQDRDTVADEDCMVEFSASAYTQDATGEILTHTQPCSQTVVDRRKEHRSPRLRTRLNVPVRAQRARLALNSDRLLPAPPRPLRLRLHLLHHDVRQGLVELQNRHEVAAHCQSGGPVRVSEG